MISDAPERRQTEKKNQAVKPYRRPVLTPLGDVRDVTLGTTPPPGGGPGG